MQFSVILADPIKGLGRAGQRVPLHGLGQAGHQGPIMLEGMLGKGGQRVSLELLPSAVHDPTELPTYLAGYKPGGLRADEVSPPILVDNDEDKFRTFTAAGTFRRVNVKGSTTGAVPEVDPASSLDTYKVVERYVGSFIPRQTLLGKGNSYNPLMAAMRRARRAIELDREIDIWTLLTTTGSWTGANVTALGAGFNWNGGVSSDPIREIQTAMEASAQQVTDIWMNQTVANAFLRHDKVRDHMRQFLGDSAPADATRTVNMVSMSNIDFVIPGLPAIHVVSSKVEAATTTALAYVLGNFVVLTTRPIGVPSDGEEIATSYTFRRRGPSGTGIEVRQFELENRGPLGGTMIVVSTADAVKMTGTDVGGLLSGVIV